LRTLQLHKKAHTAKSEIDNNGFDENLDEIELERSSDDYQEGVNESVKNTSTKNSPSNKNKRKTETPKKIRISFAKSKK
jgi:hypothetical protein